MQLKGAGLCDLIVYLRKEPCYIINMQIFADIVVYEFAHRRLHAIYKLNSEDLEACENKQSLKVLALQKLQDF